METHHLPPDDRPPETPPRRVHRGLLWAAALAVVVLAVATGVAFVSDGDDDGGSRIGGDVTGTALPAITYSTFDGATATLAPTGRPLIINFWASSCGPCIQEMPALEEVATDEDGSVDVLGLATADPIDSARRMADRTGVTYPLGLDTTGDALLALGGIGLPHTVVVAPDGTITATHTGALTADEFRQLADDARRS